ncbi:hypothetical protein [Microvirga yunnanensis]|uniref:hypothetical protein n=1 Tax=Microvirga yunnanensis TaxID=2953740 RepID=UPI0021CA701E|nr:hypothetical protein [Microvirga sp. HBU65207]
MFERGSTSTDQLNWDTPDQIEQLLIRAYVRLVYRPRRASAFRVTVVVGHIGPIDVRLTEMEPEAVALGQPPFWLEIYSHTSGSTIDSCGCFAFDEDELGRAVEMILEATRNQIM